MARTKSELNQQWHEAFASMRQALQTTPLPETDREFLERRARLCAALHKMLEAAETRPSDFTPKPEEEPLLGSLWPAHLKPPHDSLTDF